MDEYTNDITGYRLYKDASMLMENIVAVITFAKQQKKMTKYSYDKALGLLKEVQDIINKMKHKR